jgi:DNA-binding LacI/PurR family transcriptional regulator
MTLPSDRIRSASMLDVAERAGVSGQTVSRVANNMGNVAKDTRERVERAMAELGYRPNIAARALRLGAFRSIAVVTFDVETLGNVRTISAIANEAARRNYAVELIQIQSDGKEAGAADFSWAMQRLGQEAVDGIILILETTDATAAALGIPDNLPVVIVDANAGPQYPSVDANQRQGAELAVNHLLELGHSTVWHVAGPEVSNAATARRHAWEGLLKASGRDVPPVLVGDWTPESGYRAGLQLVDTPGVSAVFVANDQMALGVLRAFHEKGVAVPEQVSVVGFDDMAESAQFWPPLTTVHQHFELAGSTAVSLLVDELEGRDVTAGVRRIETELVVRDSSGSPSLASH